MKEYFYIGMAARITTDKYQNIIIDMANNNKEFFRKKKSFFL